MSSVTNRRRSVGVGETPASFPPNTVVGVGLVPGQNATGITAVVLKGGHDFWGSVPSANEHPTDAEKQALKNRLQELLANKIDISLISPGRSKWDNEYRSGSLFFKFHLRPDVTIPINRWSELTGGGTPKTLIDLTIEGGSLKSGISGVSGRGVINPPENYYGTGITTLREEPKELPRMREAPKQAPRMRAAPPQPLTQTPQTATTQPVPGATDAIRIKAHLHVSSSPNEPVEIIQLLDQLTPQESANLAFFIAGNEANKGGIRVTLWSRNKSVSGSLTPDAINQMLQALGYEGGYDARRIDPETVGFSFSFGEPPYRGMAATPAIHQPEWQRLHEEEPDSAEAIVQCISSGECPLNQMQMYAVALATKGYPSLAQAMEMRIQQAGGS